MNELYKERLSWFLLSKTICENELFQVLLHGDDFHKLWLDAFFAPPIRVAQVEIDEVHDVRVPEGISNLFSTIYVSICIVVIVSLDWAEIKMGQRGFTFDERDNEVI